MLCAPDGLALWPARSGGRHPEHNCRREFAHIPGCPDRVICRVCAHCSIRHLTDTRRERSLRVRSLQFSGLLSRCEETAHP
jgi:hypothetical protein